MSNLALRERPFVESLPAELSREFLAHHGLCPKAVADDGSLVVASTDGSLARRRGRHRVRVPPSSYDRDRFARGAGGVDRASDHPLRTNHRARAGRRRLRRSVGDDLATDVRDLANQPPVIRYVNLLVRDAYDVAASDIHLEATRSGLAARFRVDGVLVPAPEPPSHLHHAVVSRIKLLAELDIAERRRPQDGRIRVRLEARELDLRVSTVPTMYGESVVLRLLDHGGRPVTLDELGMSRRRSRRGRATSRRGRTACCSSPVPPAAARRRRSTPRSQRRDAVDRKDHHGRRSDRVSVARHHADAGASTGGRHVRRALRAILRQDPDVVMIGEMRDQETAEIVGPGGDDGASRLQHAAHERRDQRDSAPARPAESPTISSRRRSRACSRSDWCGACARSVASRTSRRGGARSRLCARARPIGRATLTRGAGCRRVSRHRISRTRRNLRAAHGHRRRSATPSRRARHARRCARSRATPDSCRFAPTDGRRSRPVSRRSRR